MVNTNILLALTNNNIANDISVRLKTLGYSIIGIVNTKTGAIRKCKEKNPDIVLMDSDLKGNISSLAAAKIISKNLQIPILYLVDKIDKTTLNLINNKFISGFIKNDFNNEIFYTIIQNSIYKHKYYIRKYIFQNVYNQIRTETNSFILLENVCQLLVKIKDYKNVLVLFFKDKLMQDLSYECGECNDLKKILRMPYMKIDYGKKLFKNYKTGKLFFRCMGNVLRSGKVKKVESLHRDCNNCTDCYRNSKYKNILLPFSSSKQFIQGIINIYVPQEYIFEEEEIVCLKRISNNLNEAIVHLLKHKILNERDFSDAIFNTAGVLIIVYDKTGKIIRFNKACMRISDYSEYEVKSCYPWNKLVLDTEKKRIKNEFKMLLAGVLIKHSQYFWKSKHGEIRLVQWFNSILLNKYDKVDYLISIGIDITEKDRAEKRIKRDLDEKNLLIKEIHHRVKNNLQIISSLLHLSTSKIQNKEAVSIIKENCNRIKSIAIIHDDLYYSKDFARIDFSNYFKKLINKIYSEYINNLGKINIEYNIENIFLPIDIAVPCGIVVNELITNTFKFAFPPSFIKKKQIYINFTTESQNGYKLVISDNGIGVPKELNFLKTSTIGLKIVRLLIIGQLKGSIRLYRKNGTKFIIRI